MNDNKHMYQRFYDFDAVELLAWNPETHVFEALVDSPMDAITPGVDDHPVEGDDDGESVEGEEEVAESGKDVDKESGQSKDEEEGEHHEVFAS